MRAWTAFESCVAACLLTRTVAVGLACEYIRDGGMNSNTSDLVKILGESSVSVR